MTDAATRQPSAEDFAALREIEVEWLMSNLGDAIKNLGYPVGCGVPPSLGHLKQAAEKLFERYAKMIEMAHDAAQASLDHGIASKAIAEYDEWMLDDDFDAMSKLHEIMGRMRARLNLAQLEESLAKATEGKAGTAGGDKVPVRRSTAGTGLQVGEASADLPATSEHMDVTAGETAPLSESQPSPMSAGERK